MMWLRKLVEGFDFLAKLLLPKTELKEWRQDLNKDFKEYGSPNTEFVYQAFDSIDTKTTAVLQHVSIMIAVSGVLFTQSTGAIRIIFGLEMIVYIFLTLFLLRFLMRQHSFSEDDLWEVARREMLLDLTTQTTFLTSLCLILTFGFELVLIT